MSPLLQARVVTPLRANGARSLWGDRTVVLRSLVPDLLPPDVLERVTKAEFGGAFMARHTRAFADGWNGEGLDPQMVDAVELRRMWGAGERNRADLGAAPNRLVGHEEWVTCVTITLSGRTSCFERGVRDIMSC